MICIHKICRVKVRWKKGESLESENELLDNPRRNRGEHLILIRKNPTMYETFVKKNRFGKVFGAAILGILECGDIAYSHYTRRSQICNTESA